VLIFIGASHDYKIVFTNHASGSGFCNNGDSQCRAIFETVLLTGSKNKGGTLSARIGYIDSKELPSLLLNFGNRDRKRIEMALYHDKTSKNWQLHDA